MRFLFPWLFLYGYVGFSSANAQNYKTIVREILPQGVELGISSESIKKLRSASFDGPTAADAQGGQYRTFMEIEGRGAPGATIYWYLCSNDRIVGALRTKNLFGVDDAKSVDEAQRIFLEIRKELGDSTQIATIKKGTRAFISVKTDVWKDSSSGLKIYFLATTKEITVAAIAPSDFPMAQVFIEPDARRFPLESRDERKIYDIERPVSKEKIKESKTGATSNGISTPIAGKTQNISQSIETSEISKEDRSSKKGHELSKSTFVTGTLLVGLIMLCFGVWRKYRKHDG